MGAEPSQLPLFPESVALTRIRPDLFGRALLVRQLGCIGTQGHRHRDPHPDASAVVNALTHAKRCRDKNKVRASG